MDKEHIITEPRVYLVGKSSLDPDMLKAFLDDEGMVFETDTKVDAEILAESAGRVCYLSFGKGRKTNAEYLENIIASHHGSVLEHVTWNFIITGISRSLTHEFIRHRAGFAYCLTGDTLIYSDHHDGRNEDGTPKKNGTKKRPLEDLYKMTLTPHGRSRTKLLRLRCLDEKNGTFTTGKVKKVICSGTKPVFHVQLDDGKTITCTKQHRFLTSNGWESLDEIVGGLNASPKGLAVYRRLSIPIMVNGLEAYKDKEWLKKHYHDQNLSHEEIAVLTGVSKHTIRAWIRKNRLQKPFGSWTIGVKPWNKGAKYVGGWRHSEDNKKLFSQQKTGDKNPQWRGGITRKDVLIRKPLETVKNDIFVRDDFCCRLCGKKFATLTLHHIIPIWLAPQLAHDPENIVSLCKSCHYSINNKELNYIKFFGNDSLPSELKEKKKGGGNLLVPRPQYIVKIEYAGEQMTYDIEMEGPYHNFVANGIVTHNSQESQRYVDESDTRYVLPPLYQEDADLKSKWKDAVNSAHKSYCELVELTDKYVSSKYPELTGTDRRKLVRQSARSVLPNACETKLFVTANARAWRHFCEMRGSAHADAEIRNLAVAIAKILKEDSPNIFADLEIVTENGIKVARVTHSKV